MLVRYEIVFDIVAHRKICLKELDVGERGVSSRWPCCFCVFLPCDFATAISRVCVWIATAIAIIFVRISSPIPFSAPTNYTLDFVSTYLHMHVFYFELNAE